MVTAASTPFLSIEASPQAFVDTRLRNNADFANAFLNRRIQFRNATRPDLKMDALRQKYQPINASGRKSPVDSAIGISTDADDSADSKPTKRQRLFNASVLNPVWNVVHPIGPGLVNLGDTCFLNSVLQCLVYTPPLANYFMDRPHHAMCTLQGFCALCELESLSRVCHGKNRSSSAVRPERIVGNLKSIGKTLRRYRQEDAHEFCRYFIDAMQKACLNGLDSKLDHRIKETTLIYAVFGGLLQSQVKCSKCKHCSNTHDPVLDLSLDILNCNSVPTALAKFTKVDQLTGANKYKCEKCNTKVDATKSMSISSAPLTLAIHLKRFNAFGKKISKPVEFEERLNIRPYMDAKGPDVYYKLYGVLVHQGGSTNSGHYYCYVRASNDMWHCMDDSSVSKASRAQVLSERAYMLFYIRTTDSILPPIRSSSLGAVGKGLVVQQGLQHVERPPQVISHKNIDIGHKVERADLSVQGVTPVIPPRRSSLGSAIFSGNVTPKKQNGVKVESVGKPSVNEPSHILVETPEPQERPEAKRSRAQEPSRDQKPLKKQRVDDADSASSSSSATSKHEHMPMTVKPKNKYGVQVTIVEHEPESTDVASLFKSNGLYARNVPTWDDNSAVSKELLKRTSLLKSPSRYRPNAYDEEYDAPKNKKIRSQMKNAFKVTPRKGRDNDYQRAYEALNAGGE